jgi:Ser/Thr protein kinase RdoA (MazF antagonist)
MLDPGSASVIARRYSLGDDASLSGPIARGELGQIWALTTSRGRFAVKESFGKFEETDGEDAEFVEAALAAGVPTPSVVRTADGELIADVGDAQVRVFGWVDLCEPDIDADPETVGRLVASIHRVPFRGERPLDPWYTDPIGAPAWDELVRTLEVRRAPFAGDLAGYRDELVALEGLLEPPAHPRTCHRDLWAENLRTTPKGGMCVIDWDNCGLADPSQELAAVLFEFASGDAGRARSLHEAYLDAGGPGAVDGPGDFSMAIAQLAHIGEIACRHWLDPDATGAERAHSAERVAEFVSRPLTRSGMEEILDAVTA